MKTGFFVVGALVQLAAAQPHRYHHQHLHEKRAVVTEVDIVTATTPDVVVFVNQYGDPVSTSYASQASATAVSVPAYSYSDTWTPTTAVTVASTTAEASTESATEASTETAYTSSAEPATTSETTTVSTVASSTSSSTSTAASSTSTSSTNRGLAYSPYTASGDCKTQADVTEDFESLDGYEYVRIYATDCSQMTTVGTAAIAKGWKIFAGVYELSETTADIATIAAFAASTSWDHFTTISVGNELVNSGDATVAEVVAAVTLAKTLLTAAGFTGDVVTVDTWDAVVANPELCEVSDFAAVNAHAFFDADATAATAGTIVQSFVDEVAAACGDKTVVVTESGWPSDGEDNGSAVPSQANQDTAIAALKAAFTDNIILFSAYNDDWKTNFDGSFGTEQYWGIYGNAASSST